MVSYKMRMTDKIKNEIRERLEIIIEQGLMTETDIVKLAEEGRCCLSIAQEINGELTGVIHPVESSPQLNDIWNNALLKVSPTVTPYFGMMMFTEDYGIVTTILYVDSKESEWGAHKKDLKNKKPYALTYLLSSDYDEKGFIVYEMFNGGPIRVS